MVQELYTVVHMVTALVSDYQLNVALNILR